MRSMILRCAVAGLLIGLVSACSDSTEPAPLSIPAEYVPGELIIQLAPGVSNSEAARRLAEQGLLLVRSVAETPPVRLIQVPQGREADWAEELVRQNFVVLAELNYIYRLD